MSDDDAPATPPLIAVTPQPPQATKVKIETPGATVEVEAHAGLEEVARVALQLFHQAGGWPQEPPRASGFASTERRDTPPAQASSMPWAPGGYPVQSP
ncbi:hypothetical protein [Actinoplanes sp. RD1]|uniref:hypothetical protein n=1 Tax=Actinoplanes sp. RD1 TaxID=3064538 RepID=UPI002741E486|nr:hypothetical protein [Actinoplanes sp. RD1]